MLSLGLPTAHAGSVLSRRAVSVCRHGLPSPVWMVCYQLTQCALSQLERRAFRKLTLHSAALLTTLLTDCLSVLSRRVLRAGPWLLSLTWLSVLLSRVPPRSAVAVCWCQATTTTTTTTITQPCTCSSGPEPTSAAASTTVSRARHLRTHLPNLHARPCSQPACPTVSLSDLPAAS